MDSLKSSIKSEQLNVDRSSRQKQKYRDPLVYKTHILIRDHLEVVFLLLIFVLLVIFIIFVIFIIVVSIQIDYGILFILIFGDEIPHILVGFLELHLVHSLSLVPVPM